MNRMVYGILYLPFWEMITALTLQRFSYEKNSGHLEGWSEGEVIIPW